MSKSKDEIQQDIAILEDRLKDLRNQLDPWDEWIEEDLREYFRFDSIVRLGECWSNFHKKQGDDFTLKDVWTTGLDEWNYQLKEGGEEFEEHLENQFQGFVDNLKERFQIPVKEGLTT